MHYCHLLGLFYHCKKIIIIAVKSCLKKKKKTITSLRFSKCCMTVKVCTAETALVYMVHNIFCIQSTGSTCFICLLLSRLQTPQILWDIPASVNAPPSSTNNNNKKHSSNSNSICVSAGSKKKWVLKLSSHLPPHPTHTHKISFLLWHKVMEVNLSEPKQWSWK